MKKPYISKIRIYPVKSLDPVELEEVEIGLHSLKFDREFAMLADDGRFVNGKRTGRVNQLKATYNLPERLITLSHRDNEHKQTFQLSETNQDLIRYLQDFFEIPLTLLRNTQGELLDIPKASSITVVSQASLESLHHDIKGHDLEDIRLRFRANLEIGGVDAYWEENLVKNPEMGVRFLIGNVEMIGISPRARCNVPPRNPLTGETDRKFTRKMMKSRSDSLPTDSALPNFGGMYHLTVNTFLPENQQGKIIKLGDEIEILEPVSL